MSNINRPTRRTLCKGPLTRSILDFPRSEVVRTGVAHHVTQSFFLQGILAIFPDEDCKFDFVVHLIVLSDQGDGDGSAWVLDCSSGFEENRWNVWKWEFHLCLFMSTANHLRDIRRDPCSSTPPLGHQRDSWVRLVIEVV